MRESTQKCRRRKCKNSHCARRRGRGDTWTWCPQGPSESPAVFTSRMECARTRTEGRSGGNCEATKREASIPSPVTMATYLHPHSATIPEHGDMKCA
ncbi:hypothetical protein EYF80_051204 [Liparis tanakae]|uniref:Uncharacterized protein n=1 Tax=Liparis tanakae TaxID=230148 RepID=A0A4Z2FCI6_9TELE|nr:hypothetical protein EYF80_051204 [Liparis tanakae]